MRHLAHYWPCLLLPVVLTGCSSTSGSRFGGKPGSKSIAVIGERPMPATTGEPGGQVAADVPEPEPRRDPKARISGRVVDEQGQPAPGVTVRLADGKAKGGKDIRASTDRAGGFTLNGLRPGSTYSLIAESDDDRGPLTGRADAMTSETGVEISLGSVEESGSTRSRSGRTSRARPISRHEESGGPLDAEATPAIHRDDLPPADEAEAPEAAPPPRSGRPRLSAPVPAVGWKKGTATKEGDEAESEAVASSSNDDAPKRSKPASPDDSSLPDDGPNPLPPAIEPSQGAGSDESGPDAKTSARRNTRRKVSDRTSPRPAGSGELALAQDRSEEEARPAKLASQLVEQEAEVSGPPPIPPMGPEPTPNLKTIEVADIAPESKPEPGPGLPMAIRDSPVVARTGPPAPALPPPSAALIQDAPTKNPAPEPVFASTADPKTETPAASGGDDYNPFLLASAAAPGPGDSKPPGGDEAPPPAQDEPEVSTAPPRKKWGEVAGVGAPTVALESTRAMASRARRPRGGVEGRDAGIALCSYDTRLRQVNDFRLPDLEGKPVRFQDLDADYILLDFWGSWSAPSVEAIPHLVALQKQYGPGRLRVVGIASEKVPPEMRRARVAEVARNLGINYAVLLSGMDGKPCPVQQSLQIQEFPTTILLDRRGQILWRDAGATPALNARLDRVLAALNKGDTVRR